jgi:hypothetical protein
LIKNSLDSGKEGQRYVSVEDEEEVGYVFAADG